jgi:AraC family L-rhamnose operon regulatory protein RhaS
MTPMQYLNDCRLDLASRFLRKSPGQSVLDIALACGFSSSQYFATVFTRRYGVSPSRFREALGVPRPPEGAVMPGKPRIGAAPELPR